MAVMQNSIIFGGIDSADFGIYISGEGVFDAPKRAVEMVTVPGRSGDVAIDQGRWENIEVTYPGFNREDDLATFAQRLSDFRNALASQIGYQQLSDTFHPNEYRMALFVDGLEIDPVKYNTASTFEIKFDCKPQRWLANGATPITVSDGQTLNNPTQYDASPLLAVDGYGTISFNGYDIEITSGDYGDITIASPGVVDKTGDFYTIPAEYIKNGDTVTFTGLKLFCPVAFKSSNNYHFYGDGRTAPTPSDTNSDATSHFDPPRMPLYGTKATDVVTEIPSVRFTIGTSETWEDVITAAGLQVTEDYGETLLTEMTLIITIRIDYDATTQKITFSESMDVSPSEYADSIVYYSFGYKGYPSRIESVVVNSTMTYLGEPTYIDCDLGEAYKIENGTFISLNSYIDLGSDLPTLAAGSNEINFDSTVESLEITPRWWKL